MTPLGWPSSRRARGPSHFTGAVRHHYSVYAIDNEGNRSAAGVIAARPATTPGDGTPPTAPGTPTATTTIGVVVRWPISTDNRMGGYWVYRDGTPVATAQQPATGTTAQYWDREATLGRHTYWVFAFDWSGHLSSPSVVSAEVKDTVAPDAFPIQPQFTKGGVISGSALPVTVAWALWDDVSGIKSSVLERSDASHGFVAVPGTPTSAIWRPATAPDPALPSYSLGQLMTAGTSVRFQATAVDLAGNIGTPNPTATYTPTIHDDSTSDVVHSGTWFQGASPAFQGGGIRYTSSTSSTTFTFTGRTTVAWVGRQAPNCGIARVILDGVDRGPVDCYSAMSKNKVVLFAATELNPLTRHTLEIRGTATKQPAATSTRVDVDAFLTM